MKSERVIDCMLIAYGLLKGILAWAILSQLFQA